MKPSTPDDSDWLDPEPSTSDTTQKLPPFNGVWRVEQEGEEGVPFPTLVSAIAEPPMGMEARIYALGVCLAEAHPERVRWMPTTEGCERIERELDGECAA